MTKNRAIKLVLFLVGLSLLFALIYKVGFSEVVRVISGAKLYFAVFGVLVYLIVIFIRSCKWFLLIRVLGKRINYRRFVPFYLVNSLMGNLTPFKSGEAVTPFLFKKYLKIPVGQGFSVVILDRFFELVIFTIILVLAVFYILNSEIQNAFILSVFRWALIALFLLLALLITALISRRITLKIARLLRLGFLEEELNVFYNTLFLFKNKKVYRFIIPLTIVVWFLEISAHYLVFSSVLSVPFINVAVAQIIAAAAIFISFVPGGVGIGEAGMVYVLGLFGYPPVLTASGVILIRLFLTGTVLGAGLVGSVFVKRLSYR